MSTNFAVVVWDIPSTATGEGITISQYTVDLQFQGTAVRSSANATRDMRGLMLSRAVYPQYVAGRTVVVMVTAVYSAPAVTGATTQPFELIVPAEGAIGELRRVCHH